MSRLALAALVALAVACTGEETGAERGAALFGAVSGLSSSRLNSFSCATCHATTAAPESDRVYPGATMHGAVARERWWGGQALRLTDAIDTCLVYFMHGQPLDQDADDAQALAEYLSSLTPAGSPTDVVPMTVVENVKAIPLGDPARGGELYRRACQHCHGETHTGKGGILRREIILPEVTAAYDTLFPNVKHGLVVIEVVRHGRFFGVGGTMPFFTAERLSDAELGDILAYLGLPSE